jgi:hypothetical protein
MTVSSNLHSQLDALVNAGNIFLIPNGTVTDQVLTVDATVGGVQFAVFHAATTHILWSNETAQCRVTFDGSAPTITNGHLIEIGDSGIWAKGLATAAKFIRTGDTSAKISASQLKS